MRLLPALVLGAATIQSATAQSADPDSDRDGLSDFQELHKYFTDPKKADSDGDGIQDGDWDERREHAYTVRSILQVMPPITRDVLCDDYQDARILEERPDYVELEVVHYPLNTVADAIVADPDWRRHVAARADLKPFLAPGITANWNPKMRDELVAALKADGIDAAKLDDRSLVEQASKWLFDHTRFADGFTTYCSTFEGGRGVERGKARVLPGLEAAAERGKNASGLTIEEQWERELFAAGMWEHRIHGSCTSSAIFVDGCLRALGIPTRIVLCMPLVDGSDEREVGWLKTKLTHHAVARTVRRGIEPLGQSWANHTFNEVFVGGRWRRLNYSKLGQNVLDAGFFGLMTHLATFSDWSDGEMAKTWGLRQNSEGKERDVFGGSNPYSCVALSDRFGAHAQVDNPAPPEHHVLTITRLQWWSSPQRTVEMRLDDPESAGHLVAHVAEVFPDEGREQYADFYADVAKEFVLRADGHDDVPVHATRGYWVKPPDDLHDFYLRIEPRDVARVQIGVAYQLVALGSSDAPRRFAVADTVTITRDAESTPFAVAAAASQGPERVLTIDSVQWSDDAAAPDWIREHLADPPRLLGHVASWNDFAEIKELTTKGDTRFFLESAGHPTLKIGVGPGGYSQGEGANRSAWVVIELDPGDWHDFVPGTSYTLRAQNSKSGWRWIVADGVKVPTRS